MKVLVTGAGGQLGRSLIAATPPGWRVRGLDRADLDITDADAVDRLVDQERPDLIVNAAAYTAVDRAESEAAQAHSINAYAVGHLAASAARVGAKLAHVSTDFVFDGRAARPYTPDDAAAPLGIYGESKLAGEAAAGTQALIVRTAWVYATRGKNFVHTMLRLMRERDEVRVVQDQIGTPTNAAGLARAICELATDGAQGIFHYTDNGVASWYDFAVAIQEEALLLGLLDRAVPIIPVPTSEFPTPAQRPGFSVLDKEATWRRLGWRAAHWRVALRPTLKEMIEHG